MIRIYNYDYSYAKYLQKIVEFSCVDIIYLTSSSYTKSKTALSTSLYFFMTQGG